MRVAGATDVARGFGPHDHLCWSYEDPDVLRDRIVDFLADGLAQGLRVSYVGVGSVGDLRHDLRDLDGLAGGLRRGAIRLVPLAAQYGADYVVDPPVQVEVYAAATDEALGAGYAGYRVAAMATPLVRSAEQLDAFVRYEHLVDRYMTGRPFSAMCAYDSTELGVGVLAQLACMHPVASTDATPFRLHAARRAAAAIGGELDAGSKALLLLALDRAALRPTAGELVLDASGLTFIDHHSLAALAAVARRHDATAVLRTGWPGVGRLVDLLELDGVRVEPAA